MSPATFVILSGVLTFGVPLLLAVRELFYLRPSGGWTPDSPPPRPPEPKPLPDCLIPKPMVRRRELELVD